MDKFQELFNCTESNINNSNISEEIDILDDCSAYIGFASEKGLIAFRVLSILSCILNIIFLIFQHLRIRHKKKENRRKISMRKLFQFLPFFDSITSLYWIFSSFYFVQARDIKNNYKICLVLSTFYLISFTFQFAMINCILIHFREINLNPIEGILKPNKNIYLYIIISFIIGLFVGFLGLVLNLIGRSPMNTCFINTKEKYGFFFLIPIIFIIIAIIQIINDLCCKGMFITDKGIRKIYKKNSTYVLIVCCLHLPMLILFLQTMLQEKGGIEIQDDVYKIYSFCVSLFTSMIPLIIGILRYLQGITKIECINDLLKSNRSSKIRKTSTFTNSSRIKKESNSNCTIATDPYEWLENHVMECFMRDILLGVATGLKKSEKYGDEILLEENNNFMDFEQYDINLENFKDFELNDDTVNESDYLCVKVINYAPKSFAYLRQIENIDINEMIESFLPKNNTHGLKKSQGKSGSFFISTDDNKYMIKSLKSDEIDLIRNGFLEKYIKHIEQTRNQSLLCRLYGMFNIILAQGDEILIIVMRNVIGDLKDNTVIKFDLKGSTYKRKADFDVNNLNREVMKDLNFNEIEKNIRISQNNINHLRNLITADSKFLSNSELMDYSLFLVKITLDKEEAADIFGENIKQNQDKALKQLFSNQISSPNIEENKLNIDNKNNVNNIYNNNEDKDDNHSILKIDNIRDNYNGKGKIHDIKYYKQYLYPSLNQGVAYIISIIDYFQYFNFYKVIEAGIISKFKTGLSKTNNNTISCVEPKIYSERFINYFNKLTDVSQIIDGSQIPYQEIPEENNENNNIDKIRYNSEEKQKMIYELDDSFDNNEEMRITLNTHKDNFRLRITIMKNNNNFSNRKTNINLINNNFKFKQ